MASLKIYSKEQTDNLLDAKADTSALATKQDTLVSGTNIKTINGNSVLGTGNIEIESGGNEWDFIGSYTDFNSTIYPNLAIGKTIKLQVIQTNVNGLCTICYFVGTLLYRADNTTFNVRGCGLVSQFNNSSVTDQSSTGWSGGMFRSLQILGPNNGMPGIIIIGGNVSMQNIRIAGPFDTLDVIIYYKDMA